jgi:hypothetical protein
MILDFLVLFIEREIQKYRDEEKKINKGFI